MSGDDPSPEPPLKRVRLSPTRASAAPAPAPTTDDALAPESPSANDDHDPIWGPRADKKFKARVELARSSAADFRATIQKILDLDAKWTAEAKLEEGSTTPGTGPELSDADRAEMRKLGRHALFLLSHMRRCHAELRKFTEIVRKDITKTDPVADLEYQVGHDPVADLELGQACGWRVASKWGGSLICVPTI